MDTDVVASTVSAVGAVTTFPTRVRGVWISGNGTGAAQVILQDGSGGATKLSLATAATPVPSYLAIPFHGVRFYNSVYVSTLTNVTSLTVFYG